MCDLHSEGIYARDYECINGIAIDIDNYTEGSWDMGFVGPAPCHPHYCESCCGTGERNHCVNGIENDDECGHCGGTGYTNQINDSIERLTAYSQRNEPDACEVCGGDCSEANPPMGSACPNYRTAHIGDAAEMISEQTS
ncbi:MAG: hypothetical protein AXW12_00470 [Thalassospira sp. Nap_22]|nr:MAG: hypothetical protein AXW12_00470 [Thalassospira sp. Nap_22]